MAIIRAYLDTCIVSGLAKEDLSVENLAALLQILEARKRGAVDLVTSEVAHDEILKIPERYRIRHSIIYTLLCDVPLVKERRLVPPFRPAAVFLRQDPIHAALESVLPDAQDASHVFQAARNNVEYLITVDKRSLLKHADKVAKVCGVKLIAPIGFLETVLDGKANC